MKKTILISLALVLLSAVLLGCGTVAGNNPVTVDEEVIASDKKVTYILEGVERKRQQRIL